MPDLQIHPSWSPLADLALLSDRHSAALVGKDGTVSWLCFPRFDSPSQFAALLDPAAGHWSLCAVGCTAVSRHYWDDTFVLETVFQTRTGKLRVIDTMALGETKDPHRLGAVAPHVLLRSAECLDGSVEVEMRFQPRPDYGQVVPGIELTRGGALARNGNEQLLLTSPIPVVVQDGAVLASAQLRAGERANFALQWSRQGKTALSALPGTEIERHLETTAAAWREWSRVHQTYEGPYRDQVYLSGRLLHALSYQPTGAIIAAPTTSLPEEIGGERNWDYRYAWIRDASLTMRALWVAACPDEAADLFTFLAEAEASYEPGKHLQILFGVGGEWQISERILPHLAGWRGSRPVRIGNGAWSQSQLDLYGELIGAAHRLREQLGELAPPLRRFLVAVVDAAARHWREADHGIWEIRGTPQHFLHSKLMCWVAVHQGVDLAERLGAEHRVPDWSETALTLRRVIEREGWSRRAGAFTQSFGSTELDASALLMSRVGFLPPTDPRVLATIDAVANRLTDERGLVRRYLTTSGVDGLPGGEGAFLPCTFWLAEALAVVGRVRRAREVFELAAGHANDLGLLAEEADSATGELLGNFPQAFSHVALINAAWAISQAEERAETDRINSGAPMARRRARRPSGSRGG
ncbi:glycoside hydrolase family 15 protein [Longimycelium tulufanense]|uniref:glycoside hydrolase family 15 protein n=1 Tax=Longimycelium tulufanense TaxID=907463 RepID=UPI001E3ECC26|nr:glycoside hydrolase family 15 protein [Longimycelium tulufanense]